MAAAKPLVSVSMITYNHEPYIAQAIESVLAQKTSFPFELVIGEDCSSDRTPEIVEHYRAQYPDVIRVLPNTERLGPNRNAARTFMACRGDYIAFLDGDDYWICEEKLEKQVKELEANQITAGVFVRTRVVTEDGAPTARVWPEDGSQTFWKLQELISWQPYHPSALLVRNPHWSSWPDWLRKVYNLDWSIGIEISKQGPLRYLDFIGSAYRITANGIWTSLNSPAQLEHRISTYRTAALALPLKNRWDIRKQLQKCHLEAIWQYRQHQRPDKARQHYWRYLANLCSIQLRHDLYVGLTLFAPRLLEAYYRFCKHKVRG